MRERLSCVERMAFGSFLRLFCFDKILKSNYKLRRTKSLLKQARATTHRALDLRSLLKMQSVVMALSRAVFTSKDHLMLAC